MRCLLHRWSRWSTVEGVSARTGLLVPSELRGRFFPDEWQQRTCESCGKMQRRDLDS